MSGVLDSSGGTTGLKFAIDSTENNVRFNPAIAGHSLPEGASYASGTGILTLPAGVWVVEAVVALEIAASSGSIGSSASASVVGRLYEGGELRYSEDSFYWRQIAHDPVVSVTGSLMVQEGSTDTVQVRLLAEPGSTTNNLEVVVTAAHMEGPENRRQSRSRHGTAYSGWLVGRHVD